MRKFKELKIWQKGIDLTVDIYKLTKKLPSDERFGLTSQMTRSAVSIPCNIAEGAGRNSDKEFDHFLSISNGSTNEIETQLIICERIGLLNSNDTKNCYSQIEEIQKMINSFKSALKKTKS